MSVTTADCFRFVQLDVPGRLGIDDGRYLVRATGGEPAEHETVLVVQTMGAPPAGRHPRRRRRARRAEPDDAPSEVPITRLTVIPARTQSHDEAKRELGVLTGDASATEEAVLDGLREANRVVRAHRIANQDPYGHEIARLTPLAVRVGFGTGDELANGKWSEAFDVPAPERRRRRADALRPQERLAELLAGREPIDVCETLLLRARADLDQGRPREAALQIGPGLEALLAELPERAGPGQEEDLAALRNLRDAMGEAGRQALRGDLSTERASQVAETLRICERVLRRRQALRDSG
ncbi:MAG TPA: hypothetical protein VKA47_03250 [Solirubrobacterales bacterium]|nr:hypothetical protein [Solirubrobacterales bacterium]